MKNNTVVRAFISIFLLTFLGCSSQKSTPPRHNANLLSQLNQLDEKDFCKYYNCKISGSHFSFVESETKKNAVTLKLKDVFPGTIGYTNWFHYVRVYSGDLLVVDSNPIIADSPWDLTEIPLDKRMVAVGLFNDSLHLVGKKVVTWESLLDFLNGKVEKKYVDDYRQMVVEMRGLTEDNCLRGHYTNFGISGSDFNSIKPGEWTGCEGSELIHTYQGQYWAFIPRPELSIPQKEFGKHKVYFARISTKKGCGCDLPNFTAAPNGCILEERIMTWKQAFKFLEGKVNPRLLSAMREYERREKSRQS